MLKIQVQIEGKEHTQYTSIIVPIVGDKLLIGCTSYVVYERVLFPDNENYIIIKAK